MGGPPCRAWYNEWKIEAAVSSPGAEVSMLGFMSCSHVSGENLSRLAEDPMGSSVHAIASTLYLLSSKLVIELTPLNLIAAMSYASAASSSVAEKHCLCLRVIRESQRINLDQ